MKVEIWSDIMCPFCYMGKRRLEKALEQFDHKEEVTVSFRSFQIDPDAKKNTGLSIHQVLANKVGISAEQAKQMNRQLAMQAKELGLDYDFDNLIPTNTYDALRLSYYAKVKGKMEEMIELMMKAYLVDGLDVGDHNVLAQLAKEIGLNRDEALTVLKGNNYSEQLLKDKQDGLKLGVQGVPFFIINDHYTISGAQPIETFSSALNQAWEEEVQKKKESTDFIDGYCSDGVCKAE